MVKPRADSLLILLHHIHLTLVSFMSILCDDWDNPKSTMYQKEFSLGFGDLGCVWFEEK